MALKGQLGESMCGQIINTRKINPRTKNCRNCRNCKKTRTDYELTKRLWCKSFRMFISDTSNAKVCKNFISRSSRAGKKRSYNKTHQNSD